MNSPILNIQQEGRKAEIIVDTGHALGNGKTWRAYAKLDCPNVFTAGLIADRLRHRIGDAVEVARREAYELGYRHGRCAAPRIEQFSRSL